MILAKVGKLSVAQDLTEADEISENVIDLSTLDYSGLTDLWLTIDCETIAAGDSSDTFDMSLVVAQAAALTTALEVLAVRWTGIADRRCATAGARILGVNIGKMLTQLADSDYRYLGLVNTLSAGGTISVNASVGFTEPPTPSHAQNVVSNVGVPAIAS